jgi:hypothetical protein
METRQLQKQRLSELAVETLLHHAHHGVISADEARARLQTLDTLDLVVPYIRHLVDRAQPGNEPQIRKRLNQLDGLGYEVTLAYARLERRLAGYGPNAA